MEKDIESKYFIPVQSVLRLTQGREDKGDVFILADSVQESMMIFTLHGEK
ncbi:MAG: hypothetical protein ACTSRA_19380 [Promethearchaeota archaeon]